MRKRIFLTVAMMAMVSLQASAQRDGFFNEWKDFDNREIMDGDMPNLPGVHGADYDQDAPLGTGIMVLTALGAGYVVAKRRKR
ncbi:MAG: hypothetical protein Q4F69_08715 [Bacteroidia bacterium]|nr:hypothetical protein [Bacteroidia bacterium]